MKMGFLFDKELRKDFEKGTIEVCLPEFNPWHFGPFSKGLLTDIEFLRNRDYIEVSPGNRAPLPAELEEYAFWVENLDQWATCEYEAEIFSLSLSKGIPKAEELWENLSDSQRNLLIGFKRALTRASLDKILEYVYKKYAKHGYIDNSVIRERYLS